MWTRVCLVRLCYGASRNSHTNINILFAAFEYVVFDGIVNVLLFTTMLDDDDDDCDRKMFNSHILFCAKVTHIRRGNLSTFMTNTLFWHRTYLFFLSFALCVYMSLPPFPLDTLTHNHAYESIYMNSLHFGKQTQRTKWTRHTKTHTHTKKRGKK